MVAEGEFSIQPIAGFFKRDRDFLALLEYTVNQNFPNPDFDLHMLSAQMKVSKRQIQRKLKVLLARTPTEYVRSKRLRSSLRYLKRGAAVNEAARAVGFASQSYFASCFKTQFGETPSDFQQRFHQEGDTERKLS